MITLAHLKSELEFSHDLGEIIDILKTAATVQFQGFRTKAGLEKRFIAEAENSLILIRHKDSKHNYFSRRMGLASCLVVITSDEGFLGDLDVMLINYVLNLRRQKDDQIIVLGERGARYLQEIGEDFVFFPGLTNEINPEEAEGLRDFILKEYKDKFNQVVVIYPEFISLTAQKITELRMLPYEPESGELSNTRLSKFELEIGPSLDIVLEGLIRAWMLARLMQIFHSSKQSELAARIIHLEGSVQELSQLAGRQSFEYFRFMHALSDKSIREISSSNILLKKA